MLFGELLGIDKYGIKAYSNQSTTNISDCENHLNDIFTGIKWQCVEYVRRWMISIKNITFENITNANDIWNLNFMTNINTNKNININKYKNGELLPTVGSILVYDTLPWGHVAVVIEIDDAIYISEQNYDNNKWNNNYSRKLKYTDNYIHDDTLNLIGFITIN